MTQAMSEFVARHRSPSQAVVSAIAIDCDSAKVLAAYNEHAVVNPASNAKLYTAAAALGILHGSHRYQTTLSGELTSDGAVQNLVLRGHGDPSLRTADLWGLALELRARGVRRVDGDIAVDQAFFDDQTTPPAFEQQPNEWAAFRAPVSAVAVNENTVTMVVRPRAAGASALVTFEPQGVVDVEGTVKTVESGADTVRLELAKAPSGPSRLVAKVSGAIAADSGVVRYTRRVEDPQLVAGYALRAIMQDAGISASGAVRLFEGGAKKSKATVLARHESEPLSTLLYALGKSSDNFYAEMIFKSLGAEAKARPGRSQDAASLATRWVESNGLGDEGLRIVNGSGLFDSNRTTTASIAKLLRWAWQEPAVRNEFVAQLAIGGVDGTLHKRFGKLRQHKAIRAKTGTLDDAIALSGYVLAPAGKSPVAFAIVFNRVSGHASDARQAADGFVEKMHALVWD